MPEGRDRFMRSQASPCVGMGRACQHINVSFGPMVIAYGNKTGKVVLDIHIIQMCEKCNQEGRFANKAGRHATESDRRSFVCAPFIMKGTAVAPEKKIPEAESQKWRETCPNTYAIIWVATTVGHQHFD